MGLESWITSDPITRPIYRDQEACFWSTNNFQVVIMCLCYMLGPTTCNSRHKPTRLHITAHLSTAVIWNPSFYPLLQQSQVQPHQASFSKQLLWFFQSPTRLDKTWIHFNWIEPVPNRLSSSVSLSSMNPLQNRKFSSFVSINTIRSIKCQA